MQQFLATDWSCRSSRLLIFHISYRKTCYLRNSQNRPIMEVTFNQTNFTFFNSSVDYPEIPEVVDKAINVIILVIVFLTMVSLGCTMDVWKIKDHIWKPKGVAIAVVAQYGIMPLSAFSLAKLLQLGPMETVAVLVCGCSPGGNLSNILALAIKGDMNLSIVMTTCSTVLALGMMPLLLYLYCQSFPGLENAVPYGNITISLVMTLVPCAVGIFINYKVPKYAKIVTKVGMSIMGLAFTALAILASITLGKTILTVTSPALMTTAALMPLIGYVLGYLLSALFRLNPACRRTVAVETGCQNNQLCASILRVAFPPEVIGPFYLFPFVYVFFQVSEALVLIILFRCHERFFSKKKKVVYELGMQDIQ
ncbi:sodium/bile acid cotransporter [Astyanax mexicanus]|uniref:Hepatic sodium/bile acid cotransporter n=1 Tax=Astyanax mexicanus TaxID=7994 RepID=A0A8T2MMK8_ASTMX|nr:sodium/bile acid cotransporter [Astyanax mexicanus]